MDILSEINFTMMMIIIIVIIIRHNAYVRTTIVRFRPFWCILCMVSFTRKMRIAGGRCWCAACNSVKRTCSTSTSLLLLHYQHYLTAQHYLQTFVALPCFPSLVLPLVRIPELPIHIALSKPRSGPTYKLTNEWSAGRAHNVSAIANHGHAFKHYFG